MVISLFVLLYIIRTRCYKISIPLHTPYLVKVSISDLNIRKGPGTNYAKTGKYTGKGVFTIVEEADGQGASRWGLLKSYQKNRDGWISLDYGKRV